MKIDRWNGNMVNKEMMIEDCSESEEQCVYSGMNKDDSWKYNKSV